MDVEALALGQQRGDAGALVVAGRVGQQQDRRQRFVGRIGGAQVGHGVGLVGVDDAAAVQRLRLEQVEGVVEPGRDGQPRCVRQRGSVRAEQRRRGRCGHHHPAALVRLVQAPGGEPGGEEPPGGGLGAGAGQAEPRGRPDRRERVRQGRHRRPRCAGCLAVSGRVRAGARRPRLRSGRVASGSVGRWVAGGQVEVGCRLGISDVVVVGQPVLLVGGVVRVGQPPDLHGVSSRMQAVGVVCAAAQPAADLPDHRRHHRHVRVAEPQVR
ncbi:hypothetical protein ACPPVO_34845 [Dactylosporangium sp. McL0621]|uniref:hypothetical protein n=1 Tax=Dactylosporangium sp. McL0621 TaxID=3415678 RepID=UPI003CEE49E4